MSMKGVSGYDNLPLQWLLVCIGFGLFICMIFTVDNSNLI